MRSGIVAIVLACSLSAGASSGSIGAARSGTRITVRGVVAPGWWLGDPSDRLHDELLGVDCSLLRAADGVTRCLPTPQPREVFNAKFSANASCTIPVAGNLSADPGTEYRYGVAPIERTAAPGEPAHRVFRTAGEIPADRPVFRMISGKCARVRRTDHERYFLVGDDVEPARFVAFTPQTDRVPPSAQKTTGPAVATLPLASGTRISILRDRFVGEDGTVTTPTDRLRDEKLRTDCSLSYSSANLCLPKDPIWVDVWSFVFADASCKKLLARASGDRKPSYAISQGNGDVRVFPVLGDHPADAPVFQIIAGRCVESEGSFDQFFTLGSEIGPTDFVAFHSQETRVRSAPDSTMLVPADRSRITLYASQIVGDDGTVTGMISRRYYDEKLETTCHPTTASDGITRCFPADHNWTRGFFADAQCTTPLVNGSTRPFRAFLQTPIEGGQTRFRIFPVGAEYPATGPVFYVDRFVGKCTANKRYPTEQFWRVGAEMPATDFVALTESQPRSASLRAPRKAR